MQWHIRDRFDFQMAKILHISPMKKEIKVFVGFCGVGFFYFSEWKATCMAYEQKKNTVSVSAMIFLAWKQTTGSLQLAATAERGAFDSELADCLNFCRNRKQSLLKLWGKKCCRHLLQDWQWLD